METKLKYGPTNKEKRMSWERAIEFILQWEGGYVNDPQDPGGETKYGVAKRSYPKEDIANLTIERAKEIAFEDFWKSVDIWGLPSDIKIMLFDMAYNCGVVTAKKYLQKAVGVDPDGVI